MPCIASLCTALLLLRIVTNTIAIEQKRHVLTSKHLETTGSACRSPAPSAVFPVESLPVSRDFRSPKPRDGLNEWHVSCASSPGTKRDPPVETEKATAAARMKPPTEKLAIPRKGTEQLVAKVGAGVFAGPVGHLDVMGLNSVKVQSHSDPRGLVGGVPASHTAGVQSQAAKMVDELEAQGTMRAREPPGLAPFASRSKVFPASSVKDEGVACEVPARRGTGTGQKPLRRSTHSANDSGQPSNSRPLAAPISRRAQDVLDRGSSQAAPMMQYHPASPSPHIESRSEPPGCTRGNDKNETPSGGKSSGELLSSGSTDKDYFTCVCHRGGQEGRECRRTRATEWQDASAGHVAATRRHNVGQFYRDCGSRLASVRPCGEAMRPQLQDLPRKTCMLSPPLPRKQNLMHFGAEAFSSYSSSCCCLPVPQGPAQQCAAPPCVVKAHEGREHDRGMWHPSACGLTQGPQYSDVSFTSSKLECRILSVF